MKRVLIIDGYARQTLPMAKGFHDIGCHVTVVCFSKLDVGYQSKYPDRKILLGCPKDDYPEQESTWRKTSESCHIMRISLSMTGRYLN